MMLLRADRSTEAEEVSRDLSPFRTTAVVWPGTGRWLARKDEADGVKTKFNTVWLSADIDVPIQMRSHGRIFALPRK